MAAGRRVFVGIFPPAELAAIAHEAARKALSGTDCRLVPSDELHLTLRFFGTTDEARIPELESACTRALAGRPAPALRIRGTGAFPDVHRARVFWLGVEDADPAHPQLSALAAALATDLGPGLASGGNEVFRPHLTVARVRELPAPDAFLGADLDLSWRPSEVRLVESRPGAAGPARFPAIATFPLSANSA